VAEELVLAVKWPRLDGEGGDEAVALVGDAGAALGIGSVGVLDGGGEPATRASWPSSMAWA